METIGLVLYLLFIIVYTFFGKVTWKNKAVENKLLKFIACALAFPFIGLIFWLLGWIGKVMLAPFASMF